MLMDHKCYYYFFALFKKIDYTCEGKKHLVIYRLFREVS